MSARGESGLITQSGDIISIPTDGNPAVGIEINSPDAWTATLVVEATINGSTWFTPAIRTPTGAAGSASFAANDRMIALVAGCAAARVRCSAYTSGSPRVTLRATKAI